LVLALSAPDHISWFEETHSGSEISSSFFRSKNVFSLPMNLPETARIVPVSRR
jgi:hypothetical protein